MGSCPKSVKLASLPPPLAALAPLAALVALTPLALLAALAAPPVPGPHVKQLPLHTLWITAVHVKL